MNILFTGGGTLGSVTPLLAIAEELRSRMEVDKAGVPDILWIGTRKGIESKLIAEYGIPFMPIFSGKLRQYFDVRNFIDPLLLCIGIAQSFFAILRFQPDIIVGAGGYVSVPVLWAGWLLRKRAVLLQLDIVPSLSNLLTAFTASAILVACEEEKKYFPAPRTHVVGIPIRTKIEERKHVLERHDERLNARKLFGIHDELPILLVMGGGTGAVFINTTIKECLSDFADVCHIIHITGKGKNEGDIVNSKYYHPFEFLTDDLISAMSIADSVVTRAGMGSLAELSYMSKACIVIPIPDSHQEQNALYVEKRQAGLYYSQKTHSSSEFARKVRKLLSDTEMRERYGRALHNAFFQDARKRAVDILMSL